MRFHCIVENTKLLNGILMLLLGDGNILTNEWSEALIKMFILWF